MGDDDKTGLGSIIDPWHESFYEALKTGDTAAAESLLTADVVFMPAGEPTLSGRRHVRAWLDQYFKNFRFEELREEDRNVTVADKWAFEWGAHSIKISPVDGGDPIEDEGRFLNIWQQQPDRKWKLWRMMWNSTRPIGAALGRFMATMNKKKGSQ